MTRQRKPWIRWVYIINYAILILDTKITADKILRYNAGRNNNIIVILVAETVMDMLVYA